MIPLSNATLALCGPAIAVPSYDRAALRGGIVHFGVGNFHRTHQAVYIDACLARKNQTAWGIVGVGLTDGPQARLKADTYRAQDGLYTVTEFAPDGTARTRVIGAMVDYLHAPADPQAVLARLVHSDTRIITLTITEGGYNIREADGVFALDAPDVVHDLATPAAPRSVFGFVVEALARRRAAGLPAFCIASCDNLRGNGDTARKAFVAFARARDPELADWIDDKADFPNAMVDRIAPQVTAADRAALNARSGIDDRLPALAENYNQWVVEDRFRQGRPDLADAGVELRDDVAAFVAVKGRMLNACHMLLSYPALLCGYRIVHDAMRDPRLVQLLTTFLDRDIIPYVDPPPGLSLERYRAMILDRFSNPAIGDQLARIASDGAAKLPIFHAKTLATLLAAGADMRREAFLLACFGRYLKAARDGTVRDDRGGELPVHEPVLTADDWEKIQSADPDAVLWTSPFAVLGLAEDAAFNYAFRQYRSALENQGASAALEMVLA